MSELTNWLMVFLRVSAMLAVFPVFSTANFPVQLRLALGALIAALVCPSLPAAVQPQDIFGWVGVMSVEVVAGLVLGFVARMIFYALDMAGAIITNEIGLSLPPGIDPMTGTRVTAPGSILYYLAAILWLSLDLHHWMLAALVKTYAVLPVGGAHLSEATVGGCRGAHEPDVCHCPAIGRADHGRLVHHFAGLFRAGPGRAADERLFR